MCNDGAAANGMARVPATGGTVGRATRCRPALGRGAGASARGS
jgi:hypothetical protein